MGGQTGREKGREEIKKKKREKRQYRTKEIRTKKEAKNKCPGQENERVYMKTRKEKMMGGSTEKESESTTAPSTSSFVGLIIFYCGTIFWKSWFHECLIEFLTPLSPVSGT